MRIQIFLFALGIVALSIGTCIWGLAFFPTLQEYEKYDELVREQELEPPIPYYSWGGGKYVNITLIVLLFLWIMFLDYTLRKKIYPVLRKNLTYRSFKRFCRSISISLYESLYRLVLGYFIRINRRFRVKIAAWFMKLETFEHVHFLTKVFKWIVLPSSISYVCAMFYFFGRNALDSIFIGILLFFYSNFLPDLPAIFRRKLYHDVRDTFNEDVSWYKKYALLLFAPFFIALVFCGVEIKWRTIETFHNFNSLAVYGVFVFILSFFALAAFPISFGGIIEVVYVQLSALLGYLTHLKVDLVF